MAGREVLRSIALLVCAISFPAVGALAAEFPHGGDSADYCAHCHTEEIFNSNCDEMAGYCLQAGTVEEVCLLCHLKENCCRPGMEHQEKLFIGERTHPSDVDADGVKEAYLPSSLPTHQDRITCRTCHLHGREGGPGYKMLRIVEVRGKEVDVTVLCADCHDEKF